MKPADFRHYFRSEHVVTTIYTQIGRAPFFMFGKNGGFQYWQVVIVGLCWVCVFKELEWLFKELSNSLGVFVTIL